MLLTVLLLLLLLTVSSCMNMTDNKASTDNMPIATTAGGDAGTLEVGDKKLAAVQNILATFIFS